MGENKMSISETQMDEKTRADLRALLDKYTKRNDTTYSPSYTDCIMAALEYYHKVKEPVIAAMVEDGDYEGESFSIFQDKGTDRYFYVTWGWGSCSGCDALQAEDGTEENIVRNMQSSIMPLKKEDVSNYIKKELQNSWNKELVNKLIEEWDKVK